MIDGGDIVDLDGFQPVGERDNKLEELLLDEEDLCIIVMLNMFMLCSFCWLAVFQKCLEYGMPW